jgi:hypothetical protein
MQNPPREARGLDQAHGDEETMTARLPLPLKYVTHSQQNSPAKRRHLEAYAKAAVREALERVDALCNEVFRPTPKDVSDKIRAMLKEYE